MFNLKLTQIIIYSFSILVSPFFVSAADLYVTSSEKNLTAGQTFNIDVMLDSNTPINAVSGELVFNDNLELVSVNEAGSVVSFWVEKPDLSADKTKVVFSGITPGGFTGQKGKVFSVSFKAMSGGENQTNISFNNVKALLNDGLGTETLVKTSEKRFSIKRDGVFVEPQVVDHEPPESFVPQIGNSDDIFSGKFFVAFSAQDKLSGIERYEIRETKTHLFSFLFPFESAESPYVLNDQGLKSFISVKAVDRAGNVRVENIEPKSKIRFYENTDLWVIITMLVLVFAVFRFLKNAKQKNS